MKNFTNQRFAAIIFIACFLSLTTIMAFRNSPNTVHANDQSKGPIDSIAGVPMTFADFTLAKTNWSATHTGATLGGSISKANLQALINSLPAENTKVSFYFGTDLNGRTFVMFAPSNANGSSSIMRNGSFCPNHCN